MEEIKKTGLRVFLDGLKTYWGYAATLFAIGAVVYAHGVTAGSTSMIYKVDKLIVSDSLRGIQQDLIIDNQKAIREDMTKVVTVVKKVSTDFVNHVSRDNNVSKQDIVSIMTGLQFEISQPVLEKSFEDPKFKIIVTKQK